MRQVCLVQPALKSKARVKEKGSSQNFASTEMGRGGRGSPGRGNGSSGRGRGGRKLKDSTAHTRCTSKIGACAELGGSIFTISSGNKARDDATLCTTEEAMVLYIGMHYREDTSKEFATGVMTVLSIPLQDATITTRHQARLIAHQARLQKKM